MPLLEKPIASPPHQMLEKHFKDWPNEAGFTANTEQREPKELKVSGKFPSYVAGRLYRTGPGTFRVDTKGDGRFSCSHWFDGFTWIHKFDMIAKDDGSCDVQYSSRCQVDGLMEKVRATGKLEGVTFGQKRDPCDSLFKKIKSAYETTKGPSLKTTYSNVGVVIGKTPGKSTSESLTISTDASMLHQFDPNTLEPYGVTDQKGLHPDLKGPVSGAHAGVDPLTGDVFNYNIEFGAKTIYRVFKTNPSTGKTEILATISDKEIKPAYMHSIFITENFVVLCIWPAYFKSGGMSILWEQNILDAIQFDPSASANWIVVDRKHGRGVVNRFTSDSMFAFHFVNGWEEKNAQGETEIFCDLAQYPNMDVLTKFYYENVISSGAGAKDWTMESVSTLQGSLSRYCLPLINTTWSVGSKPLANPRTAKVVRSIPSQYSGDLPRINESLMTKRHRYVYSVMTRDLSSFVDGLVKTDMESSDPKSSSLIWDTPKHSPGEPVFIANPDGETEDDGIVLSVVLDGQRGTSYLLCLDARTMQEIARAEVDAAVGFGFHGIHLVN